MATSTLLASFYFICGAAIIFLAVLIMRFSSRDVSTWSTALVMLFAGIGPILGAIGVIIQRNLPEGTYLFENLVESFDYTWEFFFPALLLMAFVYPETLSDLEISPKIRLHPVSAPCIPSADGPVPGQQGQSREALQLGRRSSPCLRARWRPIRTASSKSLNVFAELLFKAHNQMFSLVNVMYAVLAMILLAVSMRSGPDAEAEAPDPDHARGPRDRDHAPIHSPASCRTS